MTDQDAVPPGYKRTEIGVIPEDWKVLPIGKICTLHNGRAYALHEWETMGVPVIRLQNITGGSDYYYSNLILSEQKYCDCGDLLYMWSATFGPYIWKGGKAIYHYHIWKVSPNNEITDQLFLYYKLGEITEGMKKRASNGGTMLHITKESMESRLLLLPPLPEQHAIAAALSDADGLIGALDALIAKKRDMKQAAMQQLLTGRTRLPGFEGEWGNYPLNAFVRNFIVPMRDKPKKFTGDIPWCRIEDFDGIYLNDSKSGQYVDKEIIQEMNLKVYPKGTLLVSCSADLGRCTIVSRPLVSNQTFIGLEMDDSISNCLFFYYYMTSQSMRLNNLSSGTTISYLSREQFEEFEVQIPSDYEEQTAIATVLSDMDAEIAALKRRRDKVKEIKQGMMQQLLTGKVRLAC